MTLRLTNLAQAIDSRAPKIAIYGESGTGKTSQIAALWQLLPEGKKLLILTAEHGLRSLRTVCPDMIDAEDVIVGECHSIADVREGVALASDENNNIAWCVVDSVSNLADRELRARLEASPDPRQAYGGMMSATLGVLWQMVDVAHLGVLFIFSGVAQRDQRGVGQAARDGQSLRDEHPRRQLEAVDAVHVRRGVAARNEVRWHAPDPHGEDANDHG